MSAVSGALVHARRESVYRRLQAGLSFWVWPVLRCARTRSPRRAPRRPDLKVFTSAALHGPCVTTQDRPHHQRHHPLRIPRRLHRITGASRTIRSFRVYQCSAPPQASLIFSLLTLCLSAGRRFLLFLISFLLRARRTRFLFRRRTASRTSPTERGKSKRKASGEGSDLLRALRVSYGSVCVYTGTELRTPVKQSCCFIKK